MISSEMNFETTGKNGTKMHIILSEKQTLKRPEKEGKCYKNAHNFVRKQTLKQPQMKAK